MTNLFYGKQWYSYFWIIVLAVLIFSKTLAFRFTHFDDGALIQDNQQYLSDMSNIGSSFSQTQKYFEGYYRPILISSFIIDYRFGKANPFNYHLTNLLLHIVVCCLLFSLLMQIGMVIKNAFLFSIYFTIHPLVTQAVAWIPGRNDSLLAVSILLAFKFFLYYIEKPRAIYLLFYCFWFLVAFFTKESAVVLPFLTAVYLRFKVYNESKINSYSENKNENPKETELISQIKIALGGLIVVIIWYIMRQMAAGLIEFSISEQIFSIIRNYYMTIVYIGKIFFPVNLAVTPTIQDSTLTSGIAALCIVIPLGTIALFQKKNNAYQIVFGAVWFVSFMFPSYIHQTNLFLEHRTYVPMMGIIIMVNAIIESLPWALIRKWFFIVAVIVLPYLTALTFINTDTFMNSIIFWLNAVETSPHSALAHNNLGFTYSGYRQYDKAYKEYYEAASLDSNWLNFINIGAANLRKKDYRKAGYYYRLSLFTRGVPNSGRVLILRSYAKLLSEKGEKTQAEVYARMARSIERLLK